MSTTTIIEQLSLVMLDVSLWSGRKTLLAEDLVSYGITVENLPAEVVAALGTRRIVSPQSLKSFASLKREALALCTRYGVDVCHGGYLVPNAHVGELCQELKRVQEAFDEAREKFLAEFDHEVTEWITNHRPEWTMFITAAISSKHHVTHSLSFNYTALCLHAPVSVDDSGLADIPGRLYRHLCDEIREMASELYDDVVAEQEQVTCRRLRPLKAIRTKLAAFTFIHPTVALAAREVDQVVSSLPKKGIVNNTALKMVGELLVEKLCVMEQLRPIAGDETSLVVTSDDSSQSEPVQEQSSEVAPIAWDF